MTRPAATFFREKNAARVKRSSICIVWFHPFTAKINNTSFCGSSGVLQCQQLTLGGRHTTLALFLGGKAVETRNQLQNAPMGIKCGSQNTKEAEHFCYEGWTFWPAMAAAL